MSGYTIGGVLSQLTNSSQWHPVTYYSQKMILAKTWYKTHVGELLAIIKAFKTWQHYLEDCKHKVLILGNHDNFYRIMQTKSLSSCQVWWAQKLSQYYFQINYSQNKANGAANELSQFAQRSDDKETKLWAKNFQIFHWLQSLLTNASLSELSLLKLNASASSNLLQLH